jgi:DNA-binding NtrC family response regulator
VADVLVVDDQDRTAEVCRRLMPEHYFRGPARSWREAEDALRAARGRIDLVLLDLHFRIPPSELLGWTPGMSPAAVERLERRQGLAILGALRARWPDLPVVLTTGRRELDLQEAEDEEYTYFLEDESADERVDAQVLRALVHRIAGPARAPSDGPVWWGPSLRMRRIRQKLEVLSQGRLPVVLLGPTGTGKSLVARHFVHERSGRGGAFVQVDLSTLPRDLCAAHLFGAVKGAYTGSVSDRPGAFEAAHGGTLFLDEVGNLSVDAQKLLLTVLQEGRVARLGELRERPVDVKLVVATNEDLRRRVAQGTFRADLWMRLNPAAAVTLPPLAERGPDLAALLPFCLDQALARPYLRALVEGWAERARAAGHPVGERRVVVDTGERPPERVPGALALWFPPRALRLLDAHPWPGNLREFAMVAENAALFALAEIAAGPPGERPDVVPVRPKIVADLLAAVVSEAGPAAPDAPNRLPVALRPHDTLNKVAVDVERQYFVALWRAHDGSFARMAEVLLGDADGARKVQLRFNQLGLKVRELRGGEA